MERWTFQLDDDIRGGLEGMAAREGRTVQSLANEILRRELTGFSKREYRLNILTWKGELRLGVDLFDRDGLFDRATLDESNSR